MLSYTSSFKEKHKVRLFFLTAVILFLISNFVIYHHFYGHTTKKEYINNLPSKEKHMALNLANSPPKDAIFMGNSRTLFHISTPVLKERGFDIYNLGVSGHEPSGFPSMIEHALPYQPKSIVLCLNAPNLYKSIKVPTDVDLYDVKVYIESELSFSFIVKSFLQYLRTWILIDFYSTNLNLRIQSAYKSFDHYQHILNSKEIKKAFTNPQSNVDQQYTFDPTLVQCKIFNVARPKKLEILGMCTNGDGVLVGNRVGESAVQQEEDTEQALPQTLDLQQLRLLNAMIQKIKKKGIQPLVIFTPIYNNPYPASLFTKTAAQLDAPVIDLSRAHFGNEMWADQGHLNIKGRYVYSQLVAQQLKRYLPASSH